ncbi:uncharacterized protein LOC119466813 [Cebus imitator]|uniref:uncharacterized protein LOC119466813 n=1 Tax=Cebus imitator TaxID=2715852 RepID=UPI001897B3FB|nr:uncharacterized protein LOC119466813 [Cebus imitator]
MQEDAGGSRAAGSVAETHLHAPTSPLNRRHCLPLLSPLIAQVHQQSMRCFPRPASAAISEVNLQSHLHFQGELFVISLSSSTGEAGGQLDTDGIQGSPRPSRAGRRAESAQPRGAVNAGRSAGRRARARLQGAVCVLSAGAPAFRDPGRCRGLRSAPGLLRLSLNFLKRQHQSWLPSSRAIPRHYLGIRVFTRATQNISAEYLVAAAADMGCVPAFHQIAKAEPLEALTHAPEAPFHEEEILWKANTTIGEKVEGVF